MTTVAVLDANVLNPNALCARASVGRACHIPVPPTAIERRIAFMNAAFEDALVTGYESLIDQMDNAPKDQHVLAAAVRPHVPPADDSLALP